MRHIKLKSSLPGNRLPRPMPSKFQRSWQGVYSELPCVELRRALYHLNEFPRDIMLSSCFLLMYFALPSWRVTLWDLLKFRHYSICFSITSLKMFKDLKGSFRRQISSGCGVWAYGWKCSTLFPLSRLCRRKLSALLPLFGKKASQDTRKRLTVRTRLQLIHSKETCFHHLSSVSPRLCFCNLL